MKGPITILIADDHPLFRGGLRQIIDAQRDLRIVHETGDGAEALRVIREAKPVVAILDLDMPGMNGLEVASAIQRESLPVRVIMLTMYREEDMFNEAMDSGVLGYVLKDSAAVEILNCISAVAAGGHYLSPAISGFLVNRHDRAASLRKAKPGLSDLTPAERRILRLIAQNRTSKEIAAELDLSPRTVENHRFNICTKLDLHGVHSLVKFAFDHKSEL
ncbi:MAG TPA: DNA-binding response regulator [Verrucomicrobiales bacterium]|nr:DNA-binding response regulator [Verrucomicrobiales bacterium]